MGDPKPKRTREEAKARRKLEKAMGRKLPDALHCSFCGKSQHHVAKLIAGPRGVFICDACVGLCDLILADKPIPSHAGFKPLDLPTDELLALAGSVNYAADGAREFLQEIVDGLRKREVSWADIGERLGVSRQSAWERFS